MNFVMMTRTPKSIRFETVEYVQVKGSTLHFKRSNDQNVVAALAAIIRVGRTMRPEAREDLRALYERTVRDEPWLKDQSSFIEKSGNRPALIAVKDATGK